MALLFCFFPHVGLFIEPHDEPLHRTLPSDRKPVGTLPKHLKTISQLSMLVNYSHKSVKRRILVVDI